MNATEEFQKNIFNGINSAAQAGVHPAIIYTVLGGCQADVLASIKKMNQVPPDQTEGRTVVNEAVKANYGPDAKAETPEPVPANVVELPKPDSTG